VDGTNQNLSLSGIDQSFKELTMQHSFHNLAPAIFSLKQKAKKAVTTTCRSTVSIDFLY
jgi:hypothetical protein